MWFNIYLSISPSKIPYKNLGPERWVGWLVGRVLTLQNESPTSFSTSRV